jgi:hypothetical protein
VQKRFNAKGRLLLWLLSTMGALLLTQLPATPCLALSSTNIPLDSPVYLYIEKLSGFGLVTSDFRGIRPYSRSEAARLLNEVEERLQSGNYPPLAAKFAARLRELIPREASLRSEPEKAPGFDFNPISNARLRYVYLNGGPRDYARPVGDPGGDWIFPLPQTRLTYNPPRILSQPGSEGTPLMPNNDGVVYGSGSSLEAKWSSDIYFGKLLSGQVEPLFLVSKGDSQVILNKGYLKLGGKGLELEVGRDENWLGLGYRGAITLTNNATNLTSVKLSSPEPVKTKYLWDFKYDFIFSQLDKTVTNGFERQPFFYAVKLSMKPTPNVEFGLNLGRQQGGPGVDNSFLGTLKGMIGATSLNNSKANAGMELRYRIPWLGNTEIYGEFSGTDRSDYWPMDDSYIAGVFIPRLTPSGSDDLRFEWFFGHQILYAGTSFPEGYVYHGLPLGDSQGGATQDFFLRYSHWFSARNNLALECIYTTRGEIGRVTVDASGQLDTNGTLQAVERTAGMRAFLKLPLFGEWDANLMYGWETIQNLNLVPGASRINQLLILELSYRY